MIGSPPYWKPNQTPFTVAPDDGIVYIDHNAARCPSNPLEPLLRAVDVISPKFQWGALDIPTYRNNLRKLLRWIGHHKKPFRIDSQVARKHTVLLTRWEEQNVDSVDGFRGYGHNFDDVCSEYPSGLENSECHHRIVSYDFEGLNMLVRYEVDARLPPSTANDDVDAVSDIFSTMRIELVPKPFKDPLSNLQYIRAGPALAPTHSIIELKTRAESKRHSIDWDDVYPQLLFGGTPTLVLDLHRFGAFQKIETHRKGFPGSELARHENAGEHALKHYTVPSRQFVTLLFGKEGRG